MLWLLLAACSGSASKGGDSAAAGTDPDAPRWYGEVEPIVQAAVWAAIVRGRLGAFRSTVMSR